MSSVWCRALSKILAFGSKNNRSKETHGEANAGTAIIASPKVRGLTMYGLDRILAIGVVGGGDEYEAE